MPLAFRILAAAALACLLPLAGCSTIENLFAGDKIDYRTNTTRSAGLDIPPDLTQLAKESRYQQPNGTVSASSFQAAASSVLPGTAGAGVTPVVALQSAGSFRIERLGNERWLSTSLTPEEVYPQVRAFWKDNGFNLTQDRAEAGVIETDWAQNRAKLPNDLIRNSIGKLFDSAYSTGELDKYRTRVERTATGSDIYVTHRGMVEVYSGERRESTVWQPRPSDPELEAELLSRLMVKLGARDEQAKALMAAGNVASTSAARARMVPAGTTPTLQLDDGFDRAWRRVGIALDRSGFTVEDRDRSQGFYFVRYVDPKFAGREEPGYLTRLFRRKKDDGGSPIKYRVKVTGDSTTSSTVTVLDSQGNGENSETGKRIASLLLDDLK
ncbi:MAG: outer membrane protein assembly factor BamC [Pseudomonadota bacterium]|nr:outer membrane protein assembly factor BamC [Pseudomonadota bacterium]